MARPSFIMVSNLDSTQTEVFSLDSWLLTVHCDQEQQEQQFGSRAEVFAAVDAIVASSRDALRCITVIGPTLETWCATEFGKAAEFRKLPSVRDLGSA